MKCLVKKFLATTEPAVLSVDLAASAAVVAVVCVAAAAVVCEAAAAWTQSLVWNSCVPYLCASV